MEQTSGKRLRRARTSGAISMGDTEGSVTAEDARLVPLALIDTSVWLHALNKPGNATIQSRLRPLIVAGQAAVTESILLEVIARIRRPEHQEELLDQFAWVSRLAFDSAWWREAQELAARLRRAGRAPQATHCELSVVAVQHHVPLVHCDPTFEVIKQHLGLKTVDWTNYLKG